MVGVLENAGVLQERVSEASRRIDSSIFRSSTANVIGCVIVIPSAIIEARLMNSLIGTWPPFGRLSPKADPTFAFQRESAQSASEGSALLKQKSRQLVQVDSRPFPLHGVLPHYQQWVSPRESAWFDQASEARTTFLR